MIKEGDCFVLYPPKSALLLFCFVRKSLSSRIRYLPGDSTRYTSLSNTHAHIFFLHLTSLQVPNSFNKTSVISQLRCGGVVEAVRVCQAGYPTRYVYDELWQRMGYKVRPACTCYLSTFVRPG